MGKHMQFELTDLEREVTSQAERVEAMVVAASRGLHERCLGTAAEVLSEESVLNASEVEIEERCLKLLAMYQPVAVDLRRVCSALKINSDLERIGDLALNLAERTESLVEFPQVQVPQKLEAMVEVALDMLRDARRSFVELDADLAHAVRERDDEVDQMNEEVIHSLLKQMEADPAQVPGYLHVFSASRIVERIGDHATNIAEDVVYLVSGAIPRHKIQVSA
ncbi:MAG: phosphate signaling complex protein PhoU [Planctomycetales bacterium]|nr:phosphate signaling complex protein PhoU [Planctomycetales bacterium]